MLAFNPLDSVRESCNDVVERATHVTIENSAIEAHAAKMEVSLVGDFKKEVEWDAHGWHFSADVSTMGPLTVQYIFVMDALNFCFWPSPGFEYDTLAMALKAVLEADNTALEAHKLAVITEVLRCT
jgi:hypothetical protein